MRPDLLETQQLHDRCADCHRGIERAAANGAEAIKKRLENELKGVALDPSVSAETLQLSSGDRPWDERIAEITFRIEQLVQSHLTSKGDQ